MENCDRSYKIQKDLNWDNKKATIKMTLLYFLVSGLWLVFFERILSSLDIPKEQYIKVKTFGNWGYVILTAILLYSIVNLHLRKNQQLNQTIVESYKKLEEVNKELVEAQTNEKKKVLDLEKSKEELRQIQDGYRLALEATKDSIWSWDLKQKNGYKFDRTKSMLGYSYDDLSNNIEEWQKLLHKEDRDKAIKILNDYINKKIDIYECEYRLKSKDGTYKWFLSKGKAKFKGDEAIRMAGSHTDITKRREYEKKIYSLAYYDSLTELPNRVKLEDELNKMVRNSKQELAIIYLDIDNFKLINDAIGHYFGDALLREIGKLLDESFEISELVARMNGDEFCIIVKGAESIKKVEERLEFVRKQLENPWILDGHKLYLTLSFGISKYPKDGERVSELLKNAETAMYSAKEEGKNRYAYFEQQMNLKLLERLSIADDLREAIKNDEFKLYYQPQVDIFTGKIVGNEALIRWEHPVKGMVPPDKFIHIAEESGMIVPIGEWVIRTACKQNKYWQDQGLRPVGISVNLSGRQFESENLVEVIEGILNETKLEPRWLEVEITESLAMKNINSTIETLEKLREKGVRVALDDFGTGYSSLNYLKQLPIDTLKIDKSFVWGIHEDKKKAAIAKSLINLAHNINLSVTAEGMETYEQLEFLRKEKCDKVQGYLFGKPMTDIEFQEMIKDDKNFNEQHKN